MGNLSGRYAIVGVGETEYSRGSGRSTRALGVEAVRKAMVASLEFAAFPDVEPALLALRERGLRLVAVSNWDCSLPIWLDLAGVGGLLDGVVSSAEVGQAKPSPAIFRVALAVAGVRAREALHVGDSMVNDVEGARAVGIRAMLVARDGCSGRSGVECVRSLEEVASLI